VPLSQSSVARDGVEHSAISTPADDPRAPVSMGSASLEPLDKHTPRNARSGAIALSLAVLTGAFAGAGYGLFGGTPRAPDVRVENTRAPEPQQQASSVPAPQFFGERDPSALDAVPESLSIPPAPLATRSERSAVTLKRMTPRKPTRVEPADTGPYVRRVEPLPRIAAALDEGMPRAADDPTRGEPAPSPAQGRTSVQVEATLRGARTIDQLYRQRAAAECDGPLGFVCRESIRFGLCRDKWSNAEVRGMTICRLLARAGPPPDQ
jgi:hypothetical protein